MNDIYPELTEELLGTGSILSLLSAVPSMLISIAVYVATAYGLYTIAKRRGISKPWLAWIPVGSAWILGAVADHYRMVTEGKRKNRRKILLGTDLAVLALCLLLIVLCVVMIVGVLIGIGSDTMEMPDSAVMTTGLSAIGILVLCLPLVVLSIIHTVFYYIALYDLYKSCEPENAVLYLVLSILISYCQPIFLVLCSKKDGGMYARQPQAHAEIPAAPAEPWEQDKE